MSKSGDVRTINTRRTFPAFEGSNFRDLATRLVDDLESLPNEHGYLFVATALDRELPDVLELLRYRVSQYSFTILTKKALFKRFILGQSRL